MAEYRLGDLVFDTEEDYIAAQDDLRKIKEYMKEYDVKSPDGAKALLKKLGKGDMFLTDYGKKFMEMLKTTSNKKAPSGKVDARIKPEGKAKVHVITKKHIIIGTVIVVLLIACGIFISQNFLRPNPDETLARRNLVLGLVAEQKKVEADVKEYYISVKGMSDEEADAETKTLMSKAYTLDLTDQNVENMSDGSLELVYTQLITGGDIANDAYVEPPEITEIKQSIADARATGDMASGDGQQTTETVPEADDNTGIKVNLVNQLMDYQYKIASTLYYEYSQFDLEAEEIKEYVEEDMESIFEFSIYDMELTDEEKLIYYDSFMNKGLFSNKMVNRFSSSPVTYGLPEYTPVIQLNLKGESIRCTAIQESVAPVASVAYRLLNDNGEGYLILRSNSDGSTFLLDSHENQTVIQGDFLLRINGVTTIGEWFTDGADTGFLIDEERGSGISNVYELMY